MAASPTELISQLDYNSVTKELPEKTLEEIIGRKDEMIPHLIGVLEDACAVPENYNGTLKDMRCIHSAFLLAKFKETRAYRPLLNILRSDNGIPFDLFGDSVIEDMHRILACVYDGDLKPIKELIEDPTADEYARGCAGLGALSALVAFGKIKLADVENYFRELFEGKLEREYTHVWDVLCSMSGKLGFLNLLPDIYKAFEDDLCDWGYDDFEDIENRAMAGGDPRFLEKFQPLDDIISHMQTWCCFGHKKPSNRLSDAIPDYHFAQRLRAQGIEIPANMMPKSPFHGVGRNASCPCGSGNKFKKCCGT
ncbi:MAG: DUF1186 domain-containing protein [Akkermansiaceae bacterium]|jgi:hypothetical protein|nr:DUF1186 domain-containing protein [Luteolibacter sp.]